MTNEELEQKYGQFRNTIWCAPEHFDTVNKHKEAFVALLKDKLVDPTVKSDEYTPSSKILIVTDNLQLKVVSIK